MDFENIGKKIRKYRNLAGVTQKQLAEKIGKAESSIQKYEAGKVEIPFNVLGNIAKSLDVEIIDLLDDFTELEIENNTDGMREEYLISLGYQTDSVDNESAIIRYNGYSYRVPVIEYLGLLNDMDHHTHYTIDKLLEKYHDTKQECSEYSPIIKNRLKIKPSR